MRLAVFLSLCGRLKRLPRSGWLIGGVSRAAVESIADHVSRTVLITSILCDLINSGKEYSVDSEKALKMALLHDLPEVYTSDMGKETTQYIGLEVRRKAEEKALKDLLDMLPHELQEDYWDILAEFSKQKSIESQLVRVADKLEAVLQALEYEKAGHLHGLTKGMLEDLEEAARVCDNQHVNDLIRDVKEDFGIATVEGK